VVATREPAFGLSDQGIETGANLRWNYGSAQLVEQAVVRGEGVLAKDGPLVVATGKHTGRSAKDKFIVRDAETENNIWWDNNASISPDHFAALKADFLACVAEKQELFVADLYGGRSPNTECACASSTSLRGTICSSALAGAPRGG
jgi:phosphoenolpyruvate carboxykinase (ATP)